MRTSLGSHVGWRACFINPKVHPLVYIKARPVLLLFVSYFPRFSQSCFVEECRPEPAVCPIPAQLCWSNAPVPDMLAPASRRHPFTPTRTPLSGRRPAHPAPPPEGSEAEALGRPIGWRRLSITLIFARLHSQLKREKFFLVVFPPQTHELWTNPGRHEILGKVGRSGEQESGITAPSPVTRTVYLKINDILQLLYNLTPSVLTLCRAINRIWSPPARSRYSNFIYFSYFARINDTREWI